MRTRTVSLLAMAVAVVLTLQLGVVAAQVRGAAEISAAARTAPVELAVAPVELAVAPSLSGAVASALAPPHPSAAPSVAPAQTTPRRPGTARMTRPPRRRTPPAAKVCPPAPKVPAARATRARAIGSSVAVYDAPGAARPTRQMANPRPEDNFPLEFGVRARRGEWLQVALPVRPNGSTGWIKVGEVELSALPYRIVVERCAHRMTVYKDGQVVMREAVAVGKSQTPTPVVETFVDYVYPYSMRSGYGPWLISVAAFSEVLQDFAGGRGQIALHGTSATWSLGRDASHGCVRMRPEASTQLAKMVKPGTPVSIVA